MCVYSVWLLLRLLVRILHPSWESDFLLQYVFHLTTWLWTHIYNDTYDGPPVQKLLQELERISRAISKCHKPVFQRIFNLQMQGRDTSPGYLYGIILTTINP